MATSNRERQKQYREEKKQSGYTKVISQALKELKISLPPAPQKEIVRYGLRIMRSQNQYGK